MTELEDKLKAEWSDILQKEAWVKYIKYLEAKQRYFNIGLLRAGNTRDSDMYIKGQISGLDIAIKADGNDIFKPKIVKPTGQSSTKKTP